MALALGDIKVLELGSMLAGPFVGSLLADFGAEVIKVEKPGQLDALREWPPHKDNVPLWWKTMARNKYAITLDLSRVEGRDVALNLIARSDVVIENFRPGTLERWELDPTVLRERWPQVVWVRVSGYGQTGPYRGLSGYATIAEAFSGLAAFAGYPDRGPMVSAFPMGDYLAGVFGAYGTLTAVHARRQTGRGQIVDVSLFEPMLRVIESVVVRFDQTGEKRRRMGNQMEEDVPRNVYQTADGDYIAISCGSQRIFDNLLQAIGRVDLKDDPRFESMSARVEHRDEIDAIVRGWMAQAPARDALKRLHAAGVVAGRVNDIEDVIKDPHVIAREALRAITDPELGQLRVPSATPKLSDTPGQLRWLGRKPGADNAYVYGELLGMESLSLANLKNHGVI